jgi:hypothetical protein
MEVTVAAVVPDRRPAICRDLVGLIREPIPKLVIRFVFSDEPVERLALLGDRVRWALAVAGDRT